MGRWGGCDFRELKELCDRMEKLQGTDWDNFCKECNRLLAAAILAKVIKRTPVGKYKKSTGKKGGTLRRGWTAQTEEQAAAGGGTKDVAQYAQAINVTKQGDVFLIEIINPVHYASYVEYGHRTRGGKGWVKGRFMLTISEKELEADAPKILEQKIIKHLGGILNGQ